MERKLYVGDACAPYRITSALIEQNYTSNPQVVGKVSFFRKPYPYATSIFEGRNKKDGVVLLECVPKEHKGHYNGTTVRASFIHVQDAVQEKLEALIEQNLEGSDVEADIFSKEAYK